MFAGMGREGFLESSSAEERKVRLLLWSAGVGRKREWSEAS